jgi:hypothetical protein
LGERKSSARGCAPIEVATVAATVSNDDQLRKKRLNARFYVALKKEFPHLHREQDAGDMQAPPHQRQYGTSRDFEIDRRSSAQRGAIRGSTGNWGAASAPPTVAFDMGNRQRGQASFASTVPTGGKKMVTVGRKPQQAWSAM